MMVVGWAVMKDCEINIRTVSNTRLGAIANWLVFDRVMRVTKDMSDDEIEQLWRDKAGHAECVTVDVRVAGRD